MARGCSTRSMSRPPPRLSRPARASSPTRSRTNPPCTCRRRNCRRHPASRRQQRRLRSTAATGQTPSPTSSARSTSPPRCSGRWQTTGSTTPTCSPGPAAAERPRRRASSPAASTASKAPPTHPAASAKAARIWPTADPVRSMSSRSTRPATTASMMPVTCVNVPSSRLPLQGVHHRRGAHGHLAGIQRSAQDRRRAAAAYQVHLRHDRTREGHRHDPVADPPLSVPTGAAPSVGRLPGRDLPDRGRARRPHRATTRGARRWRICS